MKTFEPATIAAWGWKLSALAEEFGEVAQLFTYDKRDEYNDEWRDHVVKELLQTWVESIEHQGQ